MSQSAEHNDHAHEHVHQHVVPIWLLAGVLGILLFLTVVTVYTARAIDLGDWNIMLAMLIATVKGAFVVLYFMHLRWDKPFNAIALITALLFVALFISISALDTFEYERNIDTYRSDSPVELRQAAIQHAQKHMSKDEAAHGGGEAAGESHDAEPDAEDTSAEH